MPGVFISHSSKDKVLVRRLAANLVNHGFPVWFDSWELEAGDSLYARIFKGIDDSTFLLLALSPAAVRSRWVGKELNAALAMEDRLGRKIIIPIMLEACEVPSSIADRLYADFSQGWLRALEDLEVLLRRCGADRVDVTWEQTILPLSISKGLYLERVALQARYEQIVPALRAGGELMARQVVVIPDEKLDDMSNLLRATVESTRDSAHYSPELEQYLGTIYEQVRKLETSLIDGVVDIGNGLVEMGEWAFFSEASHWYARLVRSEVIFRLRRVWNLAGSGAAPLGDESMGDPLSTPTGAARFYGVESVTLCDIFDRDTSDYFKVWVDDASEVGRWFAANPQFPDHLRGFWSPHLIYRYVVPQMVARHQFYSPSSTRLVWKDLPRWMIGAA